MVLVLVSKLRREWIPEVRELSVQNRLDTKMLRVIKRIIEKKQKTSVKFQIRLAHSVEIELRILFLNVLFSDLCVTNTVP